jgi:hypothetical protein
MRPINALVFATLAGALTFLAQNELTPARLHAAPLSVPSGPNWRQQMLDSYPGAAKVDHVVARLSDMLKLSPQQAAEAHAILQRHHERILALLVAAPRSMSRAQFLADEGRIWADTHRRLVALLTPDQLDLAQGLPTVS